LPASHSLDPLKYNIDDFIFQVRIFFSNNPCFLCGLIHPVIVHMVRKRNLFWNHLVPIIKVIRIVCKARKRLRYKSGFLRQYTLTILPAFLIPYARVTFSGLSKAIPLYLQGDDHDLVLNTLSAEDPRTFTLHYGRVIDRGSGWNLMIARWLIEADKPADRDESVAVFTRSVREKHPWDEFVRLTSALCYRLMSIGRTGVVLEQEQPLTAHARLTYAGMGLGP
jgi:hypothetical protein